jgi:hypothetical protein
VIPVTGKNIRVHIASHLPYAGGVVDDLERRIDPAT